MDVGEGVWEGHVWVGEGQALKGFWSHLTFSTSLPLEMGQTMHFLRFLPRNLEAPNHFAPSHGLTKHHTTRWRGWEGPMMGGPPTKHDQAQGWGACVWMAQVPHHSHECTGSQWACQVRPRWQGAHTSHAHTRGAMGSQGDKGRWPRPSGEGAHQGCHVACSGLPRGTYAKRHIRVHHRAVQGMGVEVGSPQGVYG